MTKAIAGPGAHSALMDRVYRWQRHFYDVTRKYYLFGRDRLIREMQLRPGARILEVGCGTARNLVRIGRLYSSTRLYGVDVSSEMLRSARKNIAHGGLNGRTVLVQGYAETLTPGLLGEDAGFDAILFSYSLSMIPNWQAALAAAQASLTPDGKIHIVDFGDFRGLGLAGPALKAWLNLFHVSPRTELQSQLENLSAPGAIRRLVGGYAFLATLPSDSGIAAKLLRRSHTL